METVLFKSTEENFRKEVSGKKPNTFREVDPFDERFQKLERMSKSGDYGKISILNPRTMEMFTRQIMDVTYWGKHCIISWVHPRC